MPGSTLKKDIWKPTIIVPTNTIVTLLDNCPSPQTISIPRKAGDSYTLKTIDGPKTIDLSPPETKTADFFVTMQKYGPEQGLAVSGVWSSYIDKMGNLWFGTGGARSISL